MSLGGGKKTQVVKPSPMETELARIGQAQWQDFKTFYRPIEDAMLARTERFRSPEEKLRATGQAAASVHQDIPGSTYQTDPGGPSYGRMRDIAVSRGKGLSIGKASAKFGADSRYMTGMAEMSRMGRGIESQSSAVLGRSAALRQSEDISRLEMERSKEQSMWEGLGAIAGMTVSAGSDWFKARKPSPTAIDPRAPISPSFGTVVT